MEDAAAANAMNAMDHMTFVLVSPVLLAAGVAWSCWALLRWKGLWRAFAALPLVAIAVYFAVVLVPDWRVDPTSHNLLPFELGYRLWPSVVYMALLGAIRKSRGAPT